MTENTGSLTQSTAFLRTAYRAAVIPGIISFFSSNLALLADGILVGQYVGVKGLAAVSLSTPIILLINMIAACLSCGAETLCARAVGENHGDQAQRLYSIHLTLILIFSAVLMATGMFLMEPIASGLCGDDPSLISLVCEYTQIYLLAVPAIMLTFPPFWFLPLEGKNASVSVMMLIMGIGNILLDILFLYVLRMGVRGAALASVLSAGAASVFGMCSLHTGRHTFSLRLVRPRLKELLNMAGAGSPEAVSNLFQALRVFVVNSILLRLSGNMMLAQFMIARFTVVSAMASLTEGITLGVPQSGTAILGVYSGERDNPSILILLRQQLRIGLIGCVLLALLLFFGSSAIGGMYQVNGMELPLAMLAVSLFPTLLINILTGFYRVSGREMLSNILIISRTFVFCVVSLLVLYAIGATPWLFLVTETLLTLLLWAGLTFFIRRKERNKPLSRWLLMDRSLEDGGNSINFSSTSEMNAICEASERIGAFCADNQMAPKQTMRVSLALEEMMTLITQFNPDTALSFDVRVFSVQGVIGIRIRYGGIDFNPLSPEYEDDERFMGIQMVRNLAVETIYQCTFGVNSLLILIE